MRVLRYSFPLRFLSAFSSDFLFSIVFPHLFFPVRTKMLRYDQRGTVLVRFRPASAFVRFLEI